MKLLANFLIIMFCSLLGIAQQGNNVLKIRKLGYDTSFYNQIETDTFDLFQGGIETILPFDNNENLMGSWHENIFFDRDRIHVFGHKISAKMKKLAQSNPDKFWRKINRLVTKKKTKMFSAWYEIRQQVATKRLIKFNKTYALIWDKETGKSITSQRIVVDSSFVSSDTLDYSNYTFFSEFDTIPLVRNLFNVNVVCRNNSDFFYCLFQTLVGNMEAHYRRSMPFGYFRSTSQIAKNRYSMFFKFENFLVNKVTIIQNYKLKYYCNFKVAKDSLFILNSPTKEFERGRIARRKNKIRFRYNRRGYNFYQKKEPTNFQSRNYILKKNSSSHYGLAIAD
ncbi:MAG: hypothetical protein ABF294_08475 [Flavobacteriales bacterium]